MTVRHLPPRFFGQSRSWNLDSLARLAASVSSCPQSWDHGHSYPALSVGAGDLNLGPHVYTASTDWVAALNLFFSLEHKLWTGQKSETLKKKALRRENSLLCFKRPESCKKKKKKKLKT